MWGVLSLGCSFIGVLMVLMWGSLSLAISSWMLFHWDYLLGCSFIGLLFLQDGVHLVLHYSETTWQTVRGVCEWTGLSLSVKCQSGWLFLSKEFGLVCCWLGEKLFSLFGSTCWCLAETVLPLISAHYACVWLSECHFHWVCWVCLVWLSECHFHWVYSVCLCVAQWVPFPLSSVQHANVWLSEGGCWNCAQLSGG